jgi:HlyD family secretion protein
MKNRVFRVLVLIALTALFAACVLPTPQAPNQPAATSTAEPGATAASPTAEMTAEGETVATAAESPAIETTVPSPEDAEEILPTGTGPRVLADGKVVPVQSAGLSLQASGVVRQVTVGEGDHVKADELLLKLDDASQQVGVAQAEANLMRAQANLQQLLAGARDQEIASAEAALAAARANYERLENAAGPGNIAAAKAGVTQAQANLQRVLEGPSEGALIAARADLAAAEATLKQATSAYNEVKWRDDIGALPQSLALQQATIAFEAAQARLADLQSSATPATIAGARAGVSQAAAQLTALEQSLPSDLVAAQASVDQAEAQLSLIKEGARPEAIAIAEADVAGATASLQQALVALANTELRAPFAGVIATISTSEGEQAGPGSPVIRLADTSAWSIETSDLTEFDVVNIQPGDAVRITFDAIPDLTLPGVVTRIRPIGEDNRGDTVYKVVVTPTRNDERLLWNMTAVVEFGGQ